MSGQVGLAGVVAALSVASDLTRGHPPGEAMRACLMATELASRAGLPPTTIADVYYATLTRFAGCSATSHEMAATFGGDDVALRSRADLTDMTRPVEALRVLAGLGRGPDKLEVLMHLPVAAKVAAVGARADCEVGADLTRRLRLPPAVTSAVLCAFERFDGKGAPSGLAGEDIAMPARFAAVGYAAVMFDAVGGLAQVVQMLSRWSGRALDPAITAIVLDDAEALVRRSDPDDVWAAVVQSEPAPARTFRDQAHLDEVLAGFGDAADLKSPYFQGHSRGVAGIARIAAPDVSVDEVTAYRAGLVHDLGRVAVPTGIWNRPRALRVEEWELVRLHPYHSGRILARAPALAPLAEIVNRHHERIDRSGYPAGSGASELSAAARLLAAADVWHALREHRPHREALSVNDAASAIAAMPLDREAVRAVLRAADAPAPAFPPLPVDLTERELEVLRLLAQGLTKRQIAGRLFVSPSTVHTHTVHVYAKCEVSTRAGLAMFAMRHGLTFG